MCLCLIVCVCECYECVGVYVMCLGVGIINLSFCSIEIRNVGFFISVIENNKCELIEVNIHSLMCMFAFKLRKKQRVSKFEINSPSYSSSESLNDVC